MLGGLFESSGVTGDRLFDRSPSSEKPLGTPGVEKDVSSLTGSPTGVQRVPRGKAGGQGGGKDS